MTLVLLLQGDRGFGGEKGKKGDRGEAGEHGAIGPLVLDLFLSSETICFMRESY